MSWGLRISAVELEREYLQNDLRFWQGADTVGLYFWIICNAVQFRVFNKVELSSCNWLFHWRTLPLMLLAALELVALASAQRWYRRHRLSVMIALRLSRTASQLLAYWILQPSDLFKLSGGKETAGVTGFAAALLVLTPLTQMQQALSCLLPFRVMLPVQLAAAALYFTIYLPKQLCTLQLIPALPELAHSWCDALAAAMDQCMLLLAMLPGASGMASGCGSSRVEALLLILLFFVLLVVLFIPVAFAFMRELHHKLQYLREQQQCKVVCAWDAWGLDRRRASKVVCGSSGATCAVAVGAGGCRTCNASAAFG